MKLLSKSITIFSLLILLSGFQLIKTTLHITVLDGLGNTTEGATVQLFETEEDYLKEENVVAEQTSDKNGIVKFKDIKMTWIIQEAAKRPRSWIQKGSIR